MRRNLGFLCLLIQLNRLADFSALPALALARLYAVTIYSSVSPPYFLTDKIPKPIMPMVIG